MININHITGVNTFNIEQGTDDWLRSRCGVITASRVHEIIKPGRKKGSYSEARRSYMNELIGQVATGLIPEQSSFKQAAHGHELEPVARGAYEASKFCVITECGLVYKDSSLRCAISPDGLNMDSEIGLEIKNPFTTKVHIDTLLYGEIKPEYITQCQFSMWVSGYKQWDFCSFDFRVRGNSSNRLCVIPQFVDNEIHDKLEIEIPKFIAEMDEKLDRLGLSFGDQWIGGGSND
ncbi:exonuclease [Vibrio phage 1.276.O._10N.286.54.E4]|nr:exonuclease [Vibrio phage 1.276.O._10N.286.54.E4]